MSSRAPRPAVTDVCAQITTAGDSITIEVQASGALIPRTPYASPGFGLVRALTVLGCTSIQAQQLKQIELAVVEVVSTPVRAARFWAALPSRLTTIAVVKTALAHASV